MLLFLSLRNKLGQTIPHGLQGIQPILWWMPILTFATKILWTGSESSNTTNPKLGSFPPTPFVLMRSSTTFPKPVEGKSHMNKNHNLPPSASSQPTPHTNSSVRPYVNVTHVSDTAQFRSLVWSWYLLMKNSFSSLSSMSCGRFPTNSWWLSG